MPKSSNLKISDVFHISGAGISEIYDKNQMKVHFQGMSKTLQFPHTIAIQGAPTCSIGISPDGLYNRFNNAGRIILLNQNAFQFASAPSIRIGDDVSMLTRRIPEKVETFDDVPALKNYYPTPVPEKQIGISIATPLMEMEFKLKKIHVVRRVISPLLAGNDETLMPIGVEEYEVKNNGAKPEEITLLLPRPSLVNLQEKELKPTDQDTVYTCFPPVKGHKHEAFDVDGMKGVVMASTESNERMVIAVPDKEGLSIDTQPYFCLNHYRQDLLLNADGTFYEKKNAIPKQDYGAAISVHFTLAPKETVTVPLAIALDFPDQWYIDGKVFPRKYVKSFKNAKTRALDLAKLALDRYSNWLERTLHIQGRIFDFIAGSPSYKGDRTGALRLTRLILNELSFPLSNACCWVEEKDGSDRARFLECFDYAYINPSDVDWYSMVMLILFPNIERELCQSFVNSILAEDTKKRFYHHHASFVEARQHFRDFPEQYEGQSLVQIWDEFKVKGSVAHDVGAMPKGHPLRNVSDYAWYNNNYWVDLFPKLATRVLRNVKFMDDLDFLKKNWETLKFGLEHLKELDLDGDGIPEGNPGEVKNTFDNLVLFGVDAYDATTYMAGLKAMITMAEMVGDKKAKKQYEQDFDTVSESFQKLWRDEKNSAGKRLQYYITCLDVNTGEQNTDVWTNQLDAVWALIAMGEEPFIPDARAKQILKAIYDNNRTTMGWAMCRTEDGGKVESEQGQDVYTTSNYVFAQLLDYYGMTRESKEVYKAMDKVIFEYANSLISPDNLRAEFEVEAGETEPGPHYIVAAYPRPGAVWTHLVMQRVKEIRKGNNTGQLPGKKLQAFVKELMG